MATLVIDTATAACSVALIDEGRVIARRHAVVGRGHAEQLVPMIAALPQGGRADAVLVDVGPGSFTGVRVGIAAARGLRLGWRVPVTGFSSMTLVAAGALAHAAGDEVAVVLEGGHGELFVQCFTTGVQETCPLASLKPEAALTVIGDRPAFGSGVRWLATGPGGSAERVEALPDAADAVLLPPGLTGLPARPIYGRPPDAKPQAAT